MQGRRWSVVKTEAGKVYSAMLLIAMIQFAAQPAVGQSAFDLLPADAKPVEVADPAVIPDSASATETDGPGDIVDTAAGAGQFQVLLDAARAAGMEKTLRAEGPITVLAPTDEAFARMEPGEVDELMLKRNRTRLFRFVSAHIIDGEVPIAQLSQTETPVVTLTGSVVHAETDPEGNLSIDEAKLLQADIRCRNGLMHSIDTVLRPAPAGEPESANMSGSAGESAGSATDSTTAEESELEIPGKIDGEIQSSTGPP